MSDADDKYDSMVVDGKYLDLIKDFAAKKFRLFGMTFDELYLMKKKYSELTGKPMGEI